MYISIYMFNLDDPRRDSQDVGQGDGRRAEAEVVVRAL